MLSLSSPCSDSFLEGEEGEDTCTIRQEEIVEAVDLAAGAKVGGLSGEGGGRGWWDPQLASWPLTVPLFLPAAL